MNQKQEYDSHASKIFAGVAMRKILEDQIQLGQIDIPAVQIELHTRDELSQLLRGLQCVYDDKRTRKRVFDELLAMVPPRDRPEQWAAWHGAVAYPGVGLCKAELRMGFR